LINRDTVKYRINRLEKLGIISKFYAQIAFKVFGYLACHVFFTFSDDKIREAFIKQLTLHPNTKEITEYNDKWDLEWVLVAKDIQEFDDIVSEAVQEISGHIEEQMLLIEVDHYQTTNLPFVFNQEDLLQKKRTPFSKYLDEVDFKILELLSGFAQVSSADVARKTGVSIETAIRKVNRLYNEDIIEKFTININRDKLEYARYGFGIRFKHFTKDHEIQFREYVRNNKYIVNCVKVFGPWDVFLTIITEKQENFHSTVKSIKSHFNEIIRDADAWVAYKDVYTCSFPKVLLPTENKTKK
jgi:Lrp/AsnC family leucine-responsive transcriptional regulator